VGGWDFTDENDANPYDDGPAGFHGTHIAGIIGANDGQNFGVAPDVDLVALRVFDDNGMGDLDWVERALQWVHQNRNAFEHPITTVNVSIGAGWNSDQLPATAQFEDELKQLYDDGIVVVASAGNGFQQYHTPGLTYPAASPYAIPASSVDSDGELSDFSQRSQRSIAAPGANINSSVPDHVLGKNGIVNDWSEASGTSMAAPYVAGASVLVRQAMEMVGIDDINMDKIYQHLQNTADSVWDSVTAQSYDRLNLHRALDALLPDDNVGDSLTTAVTLATQDQTVSGWINSLGDHDVYRFTPTQDGVVHLTLDSSYFENLAWSVWLDGANPIDSSGNSLDIQVEAGKTYNFSLSDAARIGSFELQVDWLPENSNGGGSHSGTETNLGSVAQLSRSVVAGEAFSVQAARDGMLTVIVDSTNSAQGKLQVTDFAGISRVDSTWENGQLRLDLQVQVGAELSFKMPDAASWQGSLKVLNLVEQTGNTVHVQGLAEADIFRVDLSDSIELNVNGVAYQFNSQSVQRIEFDGSTEGDTINILGSGNAEKIEMRPGSFALESSQLTITGQAIEEIHFAGGGGPDRAFLYDANTNDTLYSRAQESELVGVGYRYYVSNVSRSFFHATEGGQDIAFLYDGKGDDSLAVRPQFTSIRGSDYFNYVTGFDRVNVYATEGGFDSAELYDSAGNDRFNTSGDAASIVGTNFFSYTRYFERVDAYATAGGHDVASLYASDRSAFSAGTDFASYNENGLTRAATGFEQNETNVIAHSNSTSLSFQPQSIDSLQSVPNVSSAIHGATEQQDTTLDEVANAGEGEAEFLDAPTPYNSETKSAWLLARAMEHFGTDEALLRDADEVLITDPTMEANILARLFERRT
jgi:Subtilase family